MGTLRNVQSKDATTPFRLHEKSKANLSFQNFGYFSFFPPVTQNSSVRLMPHLMLMVVGKVCVCGGGGLTCIGQICNDLVCILLCYYVHRVNEVALI